MSEEKENKLRILWVANAPWASTGYGVQTRLFVPRIQALGHHVDIAANWGLQGAVLNINEQTRVYPCGFQTYSQDVLASHAQHCKADIVITLFDSWVYDQQSVGRVRWVPWAPVDHDPIPPAVVQALRLAYQPIAYSKFGFEQMKRAGLDPRYVPHGVDTKVFAPGDRNKARRTIGVDDAEFVAVMVAANKGVPSRKAFPEALMAWYRFSRRHKGCRLYLHTNPAPTHAGYDLIELARHIGFAKEELIFCDPYWNVLGFPDGYMAQVYNAADVLLSPSMGEGFGLPIVEAQACGCPVIVGNWTSMPELCFAGWKVRGQPFYTPLGSWQFIPFIESIEQALEKAWQKRNNEELRQKAREGALAYDADRVTELYWKPVLEELAEAVLGAGQLLMVEPA